MENLIWALIVVSGSANVSLSTGYPSKALCEDAISIARTGMTLAEKKAHDEAERDRRAKELKAYQDAHPARATKPSDKKECFDNTSGDRGYGSSAAFCVMESDGMTRFYQNNSVWSYSISTSPDREIKYAKCVMVDTKDK